MPILPHLRFALTAAVVGGLIGGLSSNGWAQEPATLRLADALAEANSSAFANRQANASTQAEKARARMPLKGILPSARLEAGFVRTTDPIGAFGTLLRQRQVTPASFDPARLNSPAPVNNMSGGAIVEVPVLNADAVAGWHAARTAARASQAATDWIQYDVRWQVVRAYFGAILAHEKVTMLSAAHSAALAAERQVDRMVQQGLVTKADVLQAGVRTADIAVQLSAARSDVINATQQLALLLGRTSIAARRIPIVLPTGLPADSVLRAMGTERSAGSGEVASDPRATSLPETRADIESADLALRAARLDARRAGATVLPRLNGFARYDWNSPTALYAGRPNWTVGVIASWSLFGGGAELADMTDANARARLAEVASETTRAQAELQADQAQRALQVALERLEIMAQSTTQSREALRLVDKRYAGGLATIAELLAAESSATSAALQHAGARFDLIVAIGAHRLAVGSDPGQLASLDNALSFTPSSTSKTTRE